MKKILFTLMLLIPSVILANSIDSINMDIYVDNNGTAHITEEWVTYLNEGTEGYKPYYNLGTSEISNFKVSMNNVPYTFNSNYNVNDSFDKKKYTNGFNYIDNGVELCFGISEYGSNNYILSYDISNFVVNTSDGYQMIYWTLFPYNYNPSPDNVSIKVHSDFKYNDNLLIWGYGKYGAPTYVSDGSIIMNSDGTVYSSEYLTLLVKFDSGTFNLSTNVDKSFDEYFKMAEDGADIYVPPKSKATLKEIFLSILPIVVSFGTIALIVIIAVVNGYGYKNNKKINKKNVPLFRDIPCNKDIYYANTLVKLNSLAGYKETNIFGAIILKWIKENKIVFRKAEKDKNNNIDLTLNPTFDNPLEKELFDIMYKASKDGILEAKELEKWCKDNYSKFFNLFERINKVEIEKLKKDGHIYKRKNKRECKRVNVMDDTIYDDSVKLFGLKKFLTEFSNMKTRETLEVHIWDEYLMFAYIFGIADKVAKQLKELYPEVLVNNDIDYGTLVYINHISTSSVSAASSARSSSGGGGYSSGGGGGGSFGGGGGGGGFR